MFLTIVAGVAFTVISFLFAILGLVLYSEARKSDELKYLEHAMGKGYRTNWRLVGIFFVVWVILGAYLFDGAFV